MKLQVGDRVIVDPTVGRKLTHQFPESFEGEVIDLCDGQVRVRANKHSMWFVAERVSPVDAPLWTDAYPLGSLVRVRLSERTAWTFAVVTENGRWRALTALVTETSSDGSLNANNSYLFTEANVRPDGDKPAVSWTDAYPVGTIVEVRNYNEESWTRAEVVEDDQFDPPLALKTHLRAKMTESAYALSAGSSYWFDESNVRPSRWCVGDRFVYRGNRKDWTGCVGYVTGFSSVAGDGDAWIRFDDGGNSTLAPISSLEREPLAPTPAPSWQDAHPVGTVVDVRNSGEDGWARAVVEGSDSDSLLARMLENGCALFSDDSYWFAEPNVRPRQWRAGDRFIYRDSLSVYEGKAGVITGFSGNGYAQLVFDDSRSSFPSDVSFLEREPFAPAPSWTNAFPVGSLVEVRLMNSEPVWTRAEVIEGEPGTSPSVDRPLCAMTLSEPEGDEAPVKVGSPLWFAEGEVRPPEWWVGDPCIYHGTRTGLKAWIHSIDGENVVLSFPGGGTSRAQNLSRLERVTHHAPSADLSRFVTMVEGSWKAMSGTPLPPAEPKYPQSSKLSAMHAYLLDRAVHEGTPEGLIWFADVEMFRRHGRPISGAYYRKYDLWPTPMPLSGLEHTEFTADEMVAMERTIRKYGSCRVLELSEIAHAEPGWKYAEFDEVIPLVSSLINPNPVVTEAMRAHVTDLAAKLGIIPTEEPEPRTWQKGDRFVYTTGSPSLIGKHGIVCDGSYPSNNGGHITVNFDDTVFEHTVHADNIEPEPSSNEPAPISDEALPQVGDIVRRYDSSGVPLVGVVVPSVTETVYGAVRVRIPLDPYTGLERFIEPPASKVKILRRDADVPAPEPHGLYEPSEAAATVIRQDGKIFRVGDTVNVAWPLYGRGVGTITRFETGKRTIAYVKVSQCDSLGWADGSEIYAELGWMEPASNGW